MKWMLVVIVYGLAPVKTELLFDNLSACLKAETAMRAEWARAMNDAAGPRTIAQFHQTDPAGAAFISKQTTHGTCIPHAPTPRNSN